MQSKVDHQKIIPTARMVAYFRSFSDIPYAQKTSKALRGEETAKQIYNDDFDLATRLIGPFLEARYKCFNRFIDAYRNVFELAVGTSVERGLSVSDDPDKTYIGTDLPEMIKESKAFFKKIDNRRRTNHYLEAANVLSFEQLNAAASHFTAKRDVAIINEGLWGYLTTEEQAVCAENIRKILTRYGGKWITPVISDLESNEQFLYSFGPEVRLAMLRMRQRVVNLTGRELEKNHFANRQEAIKVLKKFGFAVSLYPRVDNLACLTSIRKLWGEREREIYEPVVGRQLVWVMSLRSGKG
jgi:hypothetical protein